MLTSFTRDKALLLAAVTSLGGAEHLETGDPLLISANYTKQVDLPVRSKLVAAEEAEPRTSVRPACVSIVIEMQRRARPFHCTIG